MSKGKGMKKKYIDGSEIDKSWLLDYRSNVQYLDQHKGYLSLVDIIEVKYKIPVDYDDSSTCLIDNGYKCMIFLPDDDHWCVSVFMDLDNNIIEWYFDMTLRSGLESGKPYFIDLYLDIAVASNGKFKVLDEDELEDALDLGFISDDEVQLAKSTCEKLIKDVIPNKAFMTDFFYDHLDEMLIK